MSYDKVTLIGFIQCPVCGMEQAGPFHRNSRRVWQERMDKARQNMEEAKNYLERSMFELDEAKRHLKAIDES